MRHSADNEPVSAAEAESLFADLVAAPALVLAVSGGPDSTALLVLAARWRAALRRGPALLAVTIDHGLRPGSAAEARAVKRLAATLGVAHRTLRWRGPKPASGLQQAARTARYRLLAAAAARARASHILVAHTRDDQAETVLFRLARGSGLTGLGAMARTAPLPTGGPVVLLRPFLDLPKSRLVATLRAAGISFAEDSSNRDPRFTRVRLRALAPALSHEGLDAARLAVLAKRLRRADVAIEAAVDREAAALGYHRGAAAIVLDAQAWGRAPAEVRVRLIGRAIAETGDEGPVELGKLEACESELAAACGRTGGARIRRTLAGAMITLAGGRITIERAPPRRKPPKPGRMTARRRPNTQKPVHQGAVK